MSTELSFFEKVFAGLLSFFKKEEAIVVSIEHDIARFADTVANIFKTSPIAAFALDTLVQAAEAINPAIVPWVNGLELEIPNVLKLISNNALELSKPLSEQEEDLLAYLKNIKEANSTVYAGIMGTLSPAIQKFIIANSGTIVLPPDTQLIVAGQAVHANK